MELEQGGNKGKGFEDSGGRIERECHNGCSFLFYLIRVEFVKKFRRREEEKAEPHLTFSLLFGKIIAS